MDKINSDVIAIIKYLLRNHLHEDGSVLYSSLETIKKGDIYLLGINPGGSNKSHTLEEDLIGTPEKSYSAYCDEDWSNNNSGDGNSKFQKRINWLIARLGYNMRDICSTNLIFFRSQNVKNLTRVMADVCWPVHEVLLNIVKPKIILTIGNSYSTNSPYAYIQSIYGGDTYEPIKANHGNYSIKIMRTKILENDVFVVGFPHLSWYSPENKVDIPGLRKIIGLSADVAKCKET